MKAVVNYVVLAGIGGVLSLPNMPLPQLAPALAASAKSLSPLSHKVIDPTFTKPYTLHLQPRVLSYRGSFPDMVHIPPCRLIDRLESGEVYDVNGNPVGRISGHPADTLEAHTVVPASSAIPLSSVRAATK